MADFKITGGKELAQALEQLPTKIQRNIMRSALAAGAKVIMREAKQNTPVMFGDLKDSLRVSTRLRGMKATADVKAGNTDAWYGHFIEFGTAAHTIKPKNRGNLKFRGANGQAVYSNGVNHPGIKAKPFMRPALDSKAKEAIIATGNKIRQRLTKQGINSPAPLEAADES
jgi:HK97 gp10 family phage protein